MKCWSVDKFGNLLLTFVSFRRNIMKANYVQTISSSFFAKIPLCRCQKITGSPVDFVKTISSTFYEQLLHWYSFAKKLKSQTVRREKLGIALLYQKGMSKMLMKLTPVVNFTNILWTAFPPISFCQKNSKPNWN